LLLNWFALLKFLQLILLYAGVVPAMKNCLEGRVFAQQWP
jgi:hypothetical protein